MVCVLLVFFGSFDIAGKSLYATYDALSRKMKINMVSTINGGVVIAWIVDRVACGFPHSEENKGITF